MSLDRSKACKWAILGGCECSGLIFVLFIPLGILRCGIAGFWFH